MREVYSMKKSMVKSYRRGYAYITKKQAHKRVRKMSLA